MAIGDNFIINAELKSFLGIDDDTDDTEVDLAVSAASRQVTAWCERDFNVADSATARIFQPVSREIVKVDDISSTTGLVIKTDEGDDGTYEVTWTTADYQLEPLNQVVAGLTDWPYTRIRASGTSRRFPIRSRLAPIQVTALWGWPAIPDPVKKATTILAARIYKRRDSPEGVLGGFGDFGAVRVGTRLDPDVEMLLAPYRKAPVGVG